MSLLSAFQRSINTQHCRLTTGEASSKYTRLPHSAHYFTNEPRHAALGQIRTATKKAGGSTKNGGSSAGRRLGIKKFSGEDAPNDIPEVPIVI